jgi:hypothetical protein
MAVISCSDHVILVRLKHRERFSVNMMSRLNPAADGRTVTVRIPISIRRRGSRKLVLAPDGTTAWAAPCRRIDNAMVKAVARAHRWRRMLESGEYASVTELAAAEEINQSYICRILRLTLLAPDIVERILDRRQPPFLQLDRLLRLLTLAIGQWPLAKVRSGSCVTRGATVYGQDWPPQAAKLASE